MTNSAAAVANAVSNAFVALLGEVRGGDMTVAVITTGGANVKRRFMRGVALRDGELESRARRDFFRISAATEEPRPR